MFKKKKETEDDFLNIDYMDLWNIASNTNSSIVKKVFISIFFAFELVIKSLVTTGVTALWFWVFKDTIDWLFCSILGLIYGGTMTIWYCTIPLNYEMMNMMVDGNNCEIRIAKEPGFLKQIFWFIISTIMAIGMVWFLKMTNGRILGYSIAELGRN